MKFAGLILGLVVGCWALRVEAQDAFERTVREEARAISADVERAMNEGKAASDSDHWQDASQAYARAVALAPHFGHALRRACTAERALGHDAKAESLCRAAVASDASPYNQCALAQLRVDSGPGGLAEAEQLLTQARAQAPDLAVVHETQAVLAIARNDAQALRAAIADIERTEDDRERAGAFMARAASFFLDAGKQGALVGEARGLIDRALERAPGSPRVLLGVAQAALQANASEIFERVVPTLLQLTPEHPQAHHLAAVRAAMHAEWSDARNEIDRAHALGLPDAAYRHFLEFLGQNEPWYVAWWPRIWRTALLWLGSIFVLLVAGSTLSSITLRLVTRLAGMAAAGNGSQHAVGVRKLYAAVLVAACILYYVSLPLVLLSALGSVAAVIYGFIAIGHIPIKLVLVLGLMALVTTWAVIKSLFVRRKESDPGTRLQLSQEPELVRVLEEVAGKVGTRVVDTVFLSPGTDISVFERGAMWRQLGHGSERCLVLGLGVLDGMQLNEFKAILAHEYGHFSNRDTAGGGLALSVRQSMMVMAAHLARGGAATWYNPAWWFFNGFFRVFLRISQGASRLQEVLADRWAAISYGSEAFARGLSHVVAQSVRFNAQADVAINALREQRVVASNLYEQLRDAKIAEGDVAQAISDAMTRAPSPYDSHPRPEDRIAWARALNVATRESTEAVPAWSVFRDRIALEQLMTANVNQALGF
jgi:Zn-dependent protease with chaperone function